MCSFAFLVRSLLHEPPQLLAAAVSALLGWSIFYAYSLERECRLLRSWRALAEREAPPRAVDVSGLGAFGLFTPRGEAPGKTMDSVLTRALVNEYLRCASLLRRYQEVHGKLPSAPLCDLGFADALLDGLSGSKPQLARSATKAAKRPGSHPLAARTAPELTKLAPTAPRRAVRTRSPSPQAHRSPSAHTPGDPHASALPQRGSPDRPAQDADVKLDVSGSDPPWLRAVHGISA